MKRTMMLAVLGILSVFSTAFAAGNQVIQMLPDGWEQVTFQGTGFLGSCIQREVSYSETLVRKGFRNDYKEKLDLFIARWDESGAKCGAIYEETQEWCQKVCATDSAGLEASLQAMNQQRMDETGGGKCQNPSNLSILDVGIYDKNGKELIEGESFLIPGETYFVYIYPMLQSGGPEKSLAKGKDKVTSGIFIKMGLDSDQGEWIYIGEVKTKVQVLNQNQWEKGWIPFIVPAEAAGYRIYIKTIVDSVREVCEINKEDNINDWAKMWFPIKGEPDFAKTAISLTSGATSLVEGDTFEVQMKFESMGKTPHAKDFVNGFFYRGPGDANWKVLATDLTEAKDTVPGTVIWKKTSSLTASGPGTHQIMACADHVNTVEELSESNNCVSSSFVVKANPVPVPEKVDLIIFVVKNWEGNVYRGRYFHPRAYPKNMGKQLPKSGSTTRFEFSGPGTNGQWVKCAERNQTAANYYPFRLLIAQVDDNSCKAPNVAGTYKLRACADANGQVFETNETNNCKEVSFTVR